MSVYNHSKTPWILDPSEGIMRILASDERATIVASNLGHVTNKEAKADAMLMVNAPVMFNAIRKAILLTDVSNEKTLNERMESIEKILRDSIKNIT